MKLHTTYTIGSAKGTPSATAHFYTDWRSWSIGLSITTSNASLALGPIWLAVFWRSAW